MLPPAKKRAEHLKPNQSPKPPDLAAEGALRWGTFEHTRTVSWIALF